MWIDQFSSTSQPAKEDGVVYALIFPATMVELLPDLNKRIWSFSFKR